MKQTKNKKRGLVLTALVMVASLSLVHCASSQVSGNSEGNANVNNQNGQNPGQTAAGPTMKKTGIFNFRGLQMGMANALSIDLNVTPVPCNTEFQGVKNNFSEKNDINNVSDATLFSALKLATCYCRIAANDATKRVTNFAGVDFTQAPAQAFSSDASKENLAKAVTKLFWVKDSAEDIADLKKAVGDLAALAPATTQGTATVVETMCSIGAASFNGIKL